MRVTCNLCKFESAGTCSKKRQAKVELTKRRTCSSYQEEPMKVFTQFRKKEKHRANIKRQEMRRAKLAAAIQNLRAEGLSTVVDGGPDVK